MPVLYVPGTFTDLYYGRTNGGASSSATTGENYVKPYGLNINLMRRKML